VDLDVRRAGFRRDAPVHRACPNADAVRNANREGDGYVVAAQVIDGHGAVPATSRPGVERADGDVAIVLSHLDGDGPRMVLASGLDRGDLYVAPVRGENLDRTVDAVDGDRAPRRNGPRPVEFSVILRLATASWGAVAHATNASEARKRRTRMTLSSSGTECCSRAL
jgi:hypothetical protein